MKKQRMLHFWSAAKCVVNFNANLLQKPAIGFYKTAEDIQVERMKTLQRFCSSSNNRKIVSGKCSRGENGLVYLFEKYNSFECGVAKTGTIKHAFLCPNTERRKIKCYFLFWDCHLFIDRKPQWSVLFSFPIFYKGNLSFTIVDWLESFAK